MKKVFGFIFCVNILSMLLFIPFFLFGEKILLFTAEDELPYFALIANRVVIIILSGFVYLFWLSKKNVKIQETIKVPLWIYLFLGITSALNIIYCALIDKSTIFPTLLITFFNCHSVIIPYFCIVKYDTLKNIFMLSPPYIIIFALIVFFFIGSQFLSEKYQDSLEYIIMASGFMLEMVITGITAYVRIYVYSNEKYIEIIRMFNEKEKIKFNKITRIEKTNPFFYTAYHYEDKLFSIPLFFVNSRKLVKLLQNNFRRD